MNNMRGLMWFKTSVVGVHTSDEQVFHELCQLCGLEYQLEMTVNISHSIAICHLKLYDSINRIVDSFHFTSLESHSAYTGCIKITNEGIIGFYHNRNRI